MYSSYLSGPPSEEYEMNAEHVAEGEKGHEQHEQLVEVSISTTAGFFPAEGFNSVPAHQKIEEELNKARHALKIKDTEGWVASVIDPTGKRTIDTTKTYRENGLSGKVEIDWGPSEGGGG
jgi:hypothetical protein